MPQRTFLKRGAIGALGAATRRWGRSRRDTAGSDLAVVEALSERVAALERAQATQSEELRVLQRWRAAVLADVEPLSPRSAVIADAVEDSFYSGFEAELRGDRRAVETMLAVHVAFFEDCPGPVLDLGAGRGEWLALLGASGIEAYGVDLNSAAVAEAAACGLDVRHEDAIGHLGALEPAQLGGVSGFHLLEHLAFGTQMALLRLCLRALRPGGRVMFETPNCENLDVGANSFWIDPTHLRPLHPALLRYMLSYAGFTDVAISGIHPRRDELDNETLDQLADDPRRNGVLSAVARQHIGPRDYVATAIKP